MRRFNTKGFTQITFTQSFLHRTQAYLLNRKKNVSEASETCTCLQVAAYKGEAVTARDIPSLPDLHPYATVVVGNKLGQGFCSDLVFQVGFVKGNCTQ